ncbi:hypothetical protein AADZ90_010600 [Aestuariibius sp. 2305UL40-4]|uniref:hypothetical protein n=1 Tax=Aestuariibius violaceus TaxID=3234132 RepID=UPI00345EB20F
MKYSVFLLSIGLAACTGGQQGVGFGDRVGGGEGRSPTAVFGEEAEFAVPVRDGRPVAAERGDGSGRGVVQVEVTTETRVGGQQTRTVQTVQVPAPGPAPTPAAAPAPAAEAAPAASTETAPYYRVRAESLSDADLDGIEAAAAEVILSVGDTNPRRDDAQTVPFQSGGVSGELRRVEVNGRNFGVIEPVSRELPGGAEARATIGADVAARSRCERAVRDRVVTVGGSSSWIFALEC